VDEIAAVETAPPVEEAAPPPPVEEPPPPVEEPPPPVEEPPPPVEEPPPPVEEPPPPAEPPPSGPAKLPADFQLKASIAELELQGGISKKQLQTALGRSMGAVRECLRNLVAEGGVATGGRVNASGTIGSKGRFEALDAEGGLDGAADCVKTHLKGARLPSADTGDYYVKFSVKYSAE
jgi:hypothetical protein